ncbi:MAG: [Fe-Fe] hydrogenase large subunit C-terminal domain-containing protein [Turicibacter sp.]
MGVINFTKANCKNCYACVRACPVQAIKIKKEQAIIMDDRCIACGLCLKACPKNLKEIESELPVVKGFVKQQKKIAVSLAPTYISLFDGQGHKVCAALKQLGITFVEETVIGAELVTQQYEMYQHQMIDTCYITSCCPTVNLLIQKHYPEMLPYLLPVISPMGAHARLLKQKYGEETQVVFIGPCLSKKLEGQEEKTVNAVLTFEDLKGWFNEAGIILNELDEVALDAIKPSQRTYPIVRGISMAFDKKSDRVDIISVDGIDECKEAIEGINAGHFNNAFFEMNACRHGCIGGPAIGCEETSVFERRVKIKKHAEALANSEDVEATKGIKIPCYKHFQPLYAKIDMPTDSEIETILNNIGKYSSMDELNCGTCGYPTCRDKAIAVYNGIAEPTMCLPFMKQKAETYSHVIFDVTPSVIMVLNKQLEIIDFNPAAERFFEIKRDKAIDLPVSVFLDADPFDVVLTSKKNSLGQRIGLNENQTTLIQSIIWIDDQEVMLCILNDITNELRHEQKMQHLKINAINMAQEVINKQMIVAQEIASLLGETTAETKVTLTRLKQLIQEDEVDVK